MVGSENKLAKKAGLKESTIANIYRQNTVPTISPLEARCGAFGITMSEFFASEESEIVEMTPQMKEVPDVWLLLTEVQRAALIYVTRTFHQK